MRNEDLVLIRHMLDSAREALAFAAGSTGARLGADRMLALALVRCVEIIGEAASRVSDETRATLPAIPWASIVGMRNRLVHAYYDVDSEVLWRTIVDDLPPLVAELEAVVGRESI
jgi:uncharacterized protein with HEPN domain